MIAKQAITPCLWFESQAEEAARFYISIFPESKLDQILTYGADTPGGKTGMIMLVDFTLLGQRFQALNGGSHDKFNDAISLVVHCLDQAQIDYYWEALSADGKPIQCGWLKDKFGVSWQIVPEELPRLMRDKDPAKARRVTEAMLKMVKIDVAALRAAFNS